MRFQIEKRVEEANSLAFPLFSREGKIRNASMECQIVRPFEQPLSSGKSNFRHRI